MLPRHVRSLCLVGGGRARKEPKREQRALLLCAHRPRRGGAADRPRRALVGAVGDPGPPMRRYGDPPGRGISAQLITVMSERSFRLSSASVSCSWIYGPGMRATFLT